MCFGGEVGGFRQQHPHHDDGGEAGDGKGEEGGRQPGAVGKAARRGGTERGAKRAGEAGQAEREVEPPAAVRDVGDNQRDQHADGRGADAVQRLQGQHDRDRAVAGKADGTQRHRGQTQHQHQPPPVALRRDADVRRQHGGEQLRHGDGGRGDQIGVPPGGVAEFRGGKRQQAGIGQLEQHCAGQ